MCQQKAKLGAAFRFCCSCSKSSCEKNYCECYKAGTVRPALSLVWTAPPTDCLNVGAMLRQGCMSWCKCINCRNPHGVRVGERTPPPTTTTTSRRAPSPRVNTRGLTFADGCRPGVGREGPDRFALTEFFS